MATISAAMVKELRQKTGAGMMDCKKALAETEGDIEEAVDFLRKKGLAAAAKKAGRVASEGLVVAAVEGKRGVVVEINSETDFVSRNDDFQTLCDRIGQAAVSSGAESVDALNAVTIADTGRTVADEITNGIATIGENISLRRVAVVEVAEGAVASYMHGQLAPGLGKIGVLVGMGGAGSDDALKAIGKQVAMHVAASAPQALTIESLDPEVVARERNVLSEQARASGKPESIIEKMVEGRIRKFYEESVLNEQTFVVNPDLKVKEAVAAAGKDAGSDMTLVAFERFALGEGIEKVETDLASEVAAAVAGT